MEEIKNEDDQESTIPIICLLSTYPPKECGIATFTKDLNDAINKKFNPHLQSKIIALSDDSNIYNYDDNVIIEINKDDIEDYITKAEQINKNKNIKLICIQHEFGIFGGEYGNHLIPFLNLLEKPVVTTFHSILPTPDTAMLRITKSICEKSSAIIVMAKKAIQILSESYDINKEKIHFIPHGIPNVPFTNSDNFKTLIHQENKTILSTFGLLNEGKGIENAIHAMPEIIKEHPDVIYLIIGETHPVVRKNEGESYRKYLMKEVKKLDLKNHVKFLNIFLPQNELIKYLLATDIYICTNLDKNQIVSGTLSYAMGCGRPCVSSPIEYANEFLSGERGIITEEENPDSYSNAINTILSDSNLKNLLGRNAYIFSRQMTWPNVATNYNKIFSNILNLKENLLQSLPEINLNHIKKSTDNFGIIQFCNHTNPDPTSGYTIDDNTRALIATVLHHKLFNSQDSLNLATTYLNFIEYCQNENGTFQNNHKNKNISDTNFEDSFGRTIWALGYTINNAKNDFLTNKAKTLLEKTLPNIQTLKSPRAISFAIIGLYHYYKKNPDGNIFQLIQTMANNLVEKYKTESSNEWQWFEEVLSYSNSKIPEALYLTYDITRNDKYLKIAEKTLKFLTNLTFIDNQIYLIGQNGWCNKNGKRAFYDQQPVDASSLVQTFLTAHKITKNDDYKNKALQSIHWFFGKNPLNQIVYDETTGGCFDGVGEHSLNINQGTESTLSYLLARLFIEEVKQFNKII